MHLVNFTKVAQEDILEFAPDPDAQDALVVALMESLKEFPRAHRRCPSRFGARARYLVESGFTVIFDVDNTDPPGDSGAQVTVRHVWPSRSEQVASLVSKMNSQGSL